MLIATLTVAHPTEAVIDFQFALAVEKGYSSSYVVEPKGSVLLTASDGKQVRFVKARKGRKS